MSTEAAVPEISVVVVAYKCRDALAECLRSCTAAANEVPGGAEIIAVDNGDAQSVIVASAPDAKLLRPGRNIGFAAGANWGIAAASGRWIALVNDDARLDRYALVEALTAGNADRRIGSVATQIRFAGEPDTINSAGIDINALGIATERFAGYPAAIARDACSVFGPSACFALYRAEMLRELGGFEERFFIYLEDADLAWRARAAGWTCVYQPLALCWHEGSATSKSGSDLKYYAVGRNRVRLLARDATTVQLLWALPAIILYDTAYVVYVALSDRTLAPLRGRLAGLRDWREFRCGLAGSRRRVQLSPARRGWTQALRMHRAYQKFTG